MSRRAFIEGAVVVVAGLSANSCVSSFISGDERRGTLVKVASAPYCAGFEGAVGTCQKDFCDRIEKDIRVESCTTYCNPDTHLELMNRAHNSGQPVYVMGFSSGANDASVAAAKFGKTVRMLFHFDPTCLARVFREPIPSNVLMWNVYQSRDSYIGGGLGSLIGGEKPERKHLRNRRQQTIIVPHEFGYLSHMGLLKDEGVIKTVKEEILRDMANFYEFKLKIKTRNRGVPKPKINVRFLV